MNVSASVHSFLRVFKLLDKLLCKSNVSFVDHVTHMTILTQIFVLMEEPQGKEETAHD